MKYGLKKYGQLIQMKTFGRIKYLMKYGQIETVSLKLKSGLMRFTLMSDATMLFHQKFLA